MKKTFFNYNKALLTVMVQADNPSRIKELMDKSIPEGAEAFGMQFEQMKSKYRTKKFTGICFHIQRISLFMLQIIAADATRAKATMSLHRSCLS